GLSRAKECWKCRSSATELLRVLRRESECQVVREVIYTANLRLSRVGQADLIIRVKVERVVYLRKEGRHSHAVWRKHRPALSSQQLPAALFQIRKIHAKPQRIRIGAYVTIRGQESIEVRFGVSKHPHRTEVFVCTQAQARALGSKSRLTEATEHCIAVWNGRERGSQTAAHVSRTEVGREIDPAAGRQAGFSEMDGKRRISGFSSLPS